MPQLFLRMNPVIAMPLKKYLTAIAAICIIAVSGPASGYDAPRDIDAETVSRPLPAVSYRTGTPLELTSLTRSSAAGSDSEDPVPSVGSYAKDFFPDLWYGTKRMFSRDNLPLAAIGFGAAALALTVDHKVSEHFARTTPLSEGWMNTADTIGNGSVEIGAGLALFGTGQIFNDKRMADAGAVSLEAFLINGVFTEGLKYITHRKRPNGGDNMSFPSGHASNIAAFSASVSEMYDWNPWIAVPLYLTTAFVGVSRIQAQEHYLSDVIAGITLGTIVGTSVGKYHKERDAKSGGSAANIAVLPLFDNGIRGGIVMIRF